MRILSNALLLMMLCAAFACPAIHAQDDLLSLLGEEEEKTEYVKAPFKATRVINNHSLQQVAEGVMDFKISHRFGPANSSWRDLWGLDNATMRVGLEYGVKDWLNVGLGRSSVRKIYDGFVKVNLLRQSTGLKNMPISIIYVATAAVTTNEWSAQEEAVLDFKHRLNYSHQLIIGSKFSDKFTLQIMPTLVHRNLVTTNAEENDVLAIGIASRQKLTKRLSLNLEYFYLLPDQVAERMHNALSLGVDLETGGHVFQFHITNANLMNEQGFITETQFDWGEGELFYGFNISRVFTVKKRKS